MVAQLSDMHCGSELFDAELLTQAVKEILAVGPDLVVVAGDLTQNGYMPEYQLARDLLRPLQDELTTAVVPGNHDARNVGYVHFLDHFGKGEGRGSDLVLQLRASEVPQEVTVLAMDSSRPDVNEGEIGRERYDWIEEQLRPETDYRIFVLHHHLVPVPGTGRERNTVADAGDVLALLTALEVNLVLCGHKHVPYVWNVGELLVVNSGTVSSRRLRGYTRPSYNLLRITESQVTVTLAHPGEGRREAAVYDRRRGRLDRTEEMSGMFSKSAWSVG